MGNLKAVVLFLGIIFIVGNIICPNSFSQSDFNGNNWVGWDLKIRLVYLAGYVDGRQRGVWEAVETIVPEILPNWEKDPRMRSLEFNITVGQMLDGLNSFYSNYRNRIICIRNALNIVKDEATGRKHWSEDEIQRLRKVSPRERSNK